MHPESVVLIGRRPGDGHASNQGITHRQAWAITAMSLWISINIAHAQQSALPLAMPVLTLAAFATFAKWSQDQRDRSDDSSGDDPPASGP